MTNPVKLFKKNWKQAKLANDASANYCSLATISSEGNVSIRTLVLREVTDDSFTFYINSTSSKWQDLTYSKQIELLVFWPTLMQQYRIRGHFNELSDEVMKAAWNNKPYSSKIMDHYYTEYHAQSSVVESKDVVLEGVNALKVRYPQSVDIPFPESAKGIALKASQIEVWNGSVSDRLHQRNLYSLSDGHWSKKTLVP